MSLDSFSSKIKMEIVGAVSCYDCCRSALLTAMLKGRRSESHIITIEPIKNSLIEIFSKYEPELKPSKKIVFKTISQLNFRQQLVIKLLDKYDDNRHCLKAFLQGLFLSAGYFQEPSSGYHLELRLESRWKQSVLKFAAKRLKINFKSRTKDKKTIYYLKSHKMISRFLNICGLFDKSVELLDFKETRNLLSGVNRLVNCEAANINRQVTASHILIDKISKLLALPKQSFWTEKLKLTAIARLKYPHDSITSLGKKLNASKSAINHRLRRIDELYKEMIEKQKNIDSF